jgi:hypothetical protein
MMELFEIVECRFRDLLSILRSNAANTALLHYTAMRCTALLNIALHCTILHCAALHCTTLHYTTLHYTTLHYTTLHYTTLHYTTQHCTPLHCTHASIVSLTINTSTGNKHFQSTEISLTSGEMNKLLRSHIVHINDPYHFTWSIGSLD